MKIKVATLEDKDTVLKFLEKTLEVSVWKDFYSDLNKEDIVTAFLTSPPTEKIVLLVYGDEEGEPFGMASFDVYNFTDSTIRVARIRSLFLEEENRGKGHMNEILDTFHHWAKRVGCSYTDVGAAKGVNLKKHGYKAMEVLYLKDIR